MAAEYEELTMSTGSVAPITSVKLRIPGHSVGLLIGTRGETIRRIEKECGLSRIHVEKDNCADAPELREVTLQGPVCAIELARPMIAEISRRRAVAWLTLPADKVPRVIGTRGATIKDIKARTGAQIDVQTTDQARRQGEVQCRIVGTDQEIADAKQAIFQVLSAAGGEAQPSPPPQPTQQPAPQPPAQGRPCNTVSDPAIPPGYDFYRQIPVPQDEFGPVIETVGAMLRRIVADANSKMVIKENESGCGGAERIAHVWSQSEASLEKATSAFHQFCKERSRSSQIGTEQQLFVEIPSERVVQFVRAIPSMKAVTGAEIRLAGGIDEENKPYRVFSITGSADEIKHAKRICQRAASDKPCPPTAEQLAFETVAPNGDEDNSADASPVQQRAILQPWLNDMQPVALNFYDPPADKYGPQPDDAHKWLEYYRKVGLVDQAAVIEALIKKRASSLESLVDDLPEWHPIEKRRAWIKCRPGRPGPQGIINIERMVLMVEWDERGSPQAPQRKTAKMERLVMRERSVRAATEAAMDGQAPRENQLQAALEYLARREHQGRAGLQGERGKRNYVWGTEGPMGQQGSRGLDGIPGNPGKRGPKGDNGERGSNPKFCPCPLEISLLHDKHPMPRLEAQKEERKTAETQRPHPPAPRATTAHPPAPSPRPIPQQHRLRDIAQPEETHQMFGDASKILVKKSHSHAGSVDRRREYREKELLAEEVKEPLSDSDDKPDLPPAISEWRREMQAEKADVLEEEEDSPERVTDAPEAPEAPVAPELPEVSEAENGEEYDDEANGRSSDYEEPSTTQRSRFHYVTKRPRLVYSY
ncbi:unnamed protein product, partial [Mesorhabditis spiculigera]